MYVFLTGHQPEDCNIIIYVQKCVKRRETSVKEMTFKSTSDLPSVEMRKQNIGRKSFFLDMAFLFKCALFLFMVVITVVTESS